MAAKPAPAPAPAPEAEVKPKSKKKLFIIIAAAVLVLLLAAGAVLFLLMQGGGEEELDETGAPAAAQQAAAARVPPEFMELDAVTINLADPGVIRFAKVGITLQLENPAAAAQVEAFMPAIQNGILRQITSRTSQDLLNPDGKDQLAADILEMVRQETGLVATPTAASPVQAVLFASMIVQ